MQKNWRLSHMNLLKQNYLELLYYCLKNVQPYKMTASYRLSLMTKYNSYIVLTIHRYMVSTN